MSSKVNWPAWVRLLEEDTAWLRRRQQTTAPESEAIMTSDDKADAIHYAQGVSIVQGMATRDLLAFAAEVLREKAPDPYNRALADELLRRSMPGGGK